MGQQHIADYCTALAELEAVVGADLNLFPSIKNKGTEMKSMPLKLLVLAGLIVSPACSKSNQPAKLPDVDYYTCTMHPSVHAEAPGKCPICGMNSCL